MTAFTHANHRSASSPRPTPEGPASDSPIGEPQPGITRSDPNAPAPAGASGRHNEPGTRPTSACPAQPPSKAGGASPRGGERHHCVGKADRSSNSDRTGQGTAHHGGHRARQRGTPPATTKAHGQVPGNPQPANPERAHNTQRTTAREEVPSNTSRQPDGCVHAWQRTVPLTDREQPPSGWTSACPEGTQPLPALKQPPSGWTTARPEGTQPLPARNSSRPDGRVSAPQRRMHTQHRARNRQHNTPSEHTGDREPSGTGHRTRNTTHRADTPVNRSQVAQDPAHATQHTERAHQ